MLYPVTTMRGKDPETGEFLSPSRSQQRREALEVLELARQLSELTPQQVSRLPVPDHLVPHIDETRRITSHVAHKRQLQYLAKQMRREDDETLEAIRDALDANGNAAREEAAMLHRAEAWRERLIADGDAALAELLDAWPHADRQHLRRLARNAHEERLKNKPPHAYRELFRALRELFATAESDDPATDSGDAFDAEP
jgi:ribosome-associated protein